ncbi:MAG: Hpt domain-containing protein [Salinivirgaceae bacterium]|jgi:HPt (histidine-containing phosphotransfer) domain-containing protein|nr:Hpt domain-containing protein [Salinivirgaceae bacterium]
MENAKDFQVLIIDDERVGQAYLEEITDEVLPYGVLKKSVSTAKAMDLLNDHNFRCVFCNVPDIQFLDGDFFVTLKNHIAQKSHCFLLLIVDNDVMNAIGHELRGGVDEIITKPINKIALKMYFINKHEAMDDPAEYPQSDYTYLLNPKRIIKLYNNNGKKIAGILNMYRETLPKQIDMLARAFNSGSLDLLKSAAHSLKNSFAYLGNQDLYLVALGIEEDTDRKPGMAEFEQRVFLVLNAERDLQNALLHLIEHYENN